MPPFRPFPFPNFTIGTDICRVSRVKNLISGAFANETSKFPRFLHRVLTHREQVAFYERFPRAVKPATISRLISKGVAARKKTAGQDLVFEEDEGEGVARYLAGRWAAKEAIVKGCTWRRLTFDEIQILKSASGPSVYGVILDKASFHVPPEGMVSPAAKSRLQHAADSESGQIVKVSISHDGDYATAVCLAVEEPRKDDVGGEAAAREL